MAYVFRARGVGELVDATFRIYRAYWWITIKIVGLLLVPVGVIQAGLQAYSRLVFQRFGTNLDPGALLGLMGISLGMQVPAIIYTLATMVTDAAVTKETGDICHGRVPSVGAAWQAVRERLGPVIGAGALTLVFVLLGTCCLCLVGGPVISVFLTAFIPLIMLERASAGQALSRSFKLVRGGFWRALLVQLVIVLIMLVPAFLLWLAVGLILAVNQRQPLGALESFNTAGPVLILLFYLISTAYSAAVAPIYSIAKTLIYFDLRIRQEGYDLERAAAETGLATGGNTGAPLS